MQLISKFNKRIRFLLCVIDIFSKYAWVIALKDKKGVSILNEPKRKPRKSWKEKKNDIKMYSIQNEGKSVVAERFIRTVKNKI